MAFHRRIAIIIIIKFIFNSFIISTLDCLCLFWTNEPRELNKEKLIKTPQAVCVCFCVCASNRLLFKHIWFDHILFIAIYIETVESRVTRVEIIGQLSKLNGFNCVLAALKHYSIVEVWHSTA